MICYRFLISLLAYYVKWIKAYLTMKNWMIGDSIEIIEVIFRSTDLAIERSLVEMSLFCHIFVFNVSVCPGLVVVLLLVVRPFVPCPLVVVVVVVVVIVFNENRLGIYSPRAS